MKRSKYIVGLVFATFFVISLLTNILGPIIPDIIGSFHVSLAAAALLPFSFFIAYGVLSIPAGFLVERGERNGSCWLPLLWRWPAPCFSRCCPCITFPWCPCF